jgi:hypothetical protein
MGYNGHPVNLGQVAPHPYQPPYQQPYPPYPAYQYPQYNQYSQYNQPPQQFRSPPRAYEVAFTSWSGRHMQVAEETRDGPLAYTADLHTRRPHMIFQAKGTANLPATVTFHNFSSKIDVTINGADLRLRSESKWKHAYGFDSRAIGGKQLLWKGKGVSMTTECTDRAGAVYAKFTEHKGWSGKRAGRLEIFPPVAVGGKALADELVVTGLATVYLLILQSSGG